MITKLDSNYHNKLMEYLKQEPEFNLFIIGDIYRYGYKNYFFNIWADININGDIDGVLVKYFEFVTVYSNSIVNINEFYNVIKDMQIYEISGKSEIAESLAKKMNMSKIRRVNFCKLEKNTYLNMDSRDKNIKKIKHRNLRKIVHLYSIIDEFENTSVDCIKNGLKTGRGYYIDINKKAVAMAKSTAENYTHAMIVGVGTHPLFRQKGYASKCITKLCRELLNENKIPCLFYDNEDAGKLYKKIGFEKIGNWSICSR